MKNCLIKFVQKNMGTARLEEQTIGVLLIGIWNRIIQWIAMTFLPMLPSWRVALQRLRGVKIGRNVFIGAGCYFDPVRPDLITIEDLVSLNGKATILTHSIPTEPLREILIEKAIVHAPVCIKRGASIGMGALILPGVTIGECAIVGAGTVVSTDVPSYSVAVGNPARIVKKIKVEDK